MKKYVQISVVVGIFIILLLIKQFHGEEAPVVTNQNTSTPTNVVQQNTPSTGSSSPMYKDGTYTGTAADAFYGNVQVQVTITGGKITDVQFLQHPNDNPTTQMINNQAMPLLRQEAITAQSAQVDIVTGASQTSGAFQQSLSSALQQAI